MRSVIIAYSDPTIASQLKRVLVENSIKVAFVCSRGSSVLHLACDLAEAVVICPIILPDMPAHHLAEMLPIGFDILALSKRPATFNGSSSLSVATLPLNRGDFICQVSQLCKSSSFVSPRRKEKVTGNSEILSEAKAIIMAENGVSEDLAHKRLQHISMAQGKKIVETAMEIINNTKR